MSSSTRKRKHPLSTGTHAPSLTALQSNQISYESDPSLFIQAHEADVVRGPQARVAAKSLEVINRNELNGSITSVIGDGLIKWGGSGSNVMRKPSMIVDEMIFEGQDGGGGGGLEGERDAIWVDRYDACLLLDALPSTSKVIHGKVPGSPGGWSDLPSDTEDTFFFSPEEADDYRIEKRRRVNDQNREVRLKAIRATDPDDEPEEIWGGSDEEPDISQQELMRRTALHILSSPNPGQLEMRILANHGSDKRFAFLRGRWARSWKTEKESVNAEIEAKKKSEIERVGLGILANYGDSDEEEVEEPDIDTDQGPAEAKYAEVITQDVLDTTNDAAAKEARRARAREWAQKRRALTSSQS